MIRLPPTSTTLAQDDIQFHMQQIDVYHGLLKQGFKKKEIIKYFRQHKSATDSVMNPEVGRADQALAPAEVAQKADAGRKHKHRDFSSPPVAHPDDSFLVDSPTSHANGENSDISKTSDFPPNFDPVFSSPLHHTQPREQDSSPPELLSMKSRRHAPRQSSLLRFARTLSSSDSAVTNSPEQSFVPQRPCVTYRPRSHTYPYDQSTFSDSSPKTNTDTLDLEALEHLTLEESLLPLSQSMRIVSPTSSTLRPQAKEFRPIHTAAPSERNDGLPPQAEETFAAPYWVIPINEQSVTAELQSSPPLPGSIFIPNHRNVVVDDTDNDVNSSPPLLPQGRFNVHISSPVLPSIPMTPTRRRQDLQPRTDPRQSYNQYLDGSFAVYDDSIPANVQPQTVADVARVSVITEYNAAYTAPPGMIRSEPVRRGYARRTLEQEPGEQSPTTRAIEMRERRQREFLRSVRTEGLRLGRLRDGGTRGEAPETERLWQGLEQIRLDLWRDDLDADRVGEENFDQEATTTRLEWDVRIVSGNRRVT